MITLDHYKQLLALTNYQHMQARRLIAELTNEGIFLEVPNQLPEPELLFLDSRVNYQNRKELHDMLLFRHQSLALDLVIHVAGLLGDLGLSTENEQAAHELFRQILIETKPFVEQHYLNLGFSKPALRAPDFNRALMYYVRTVYFGWSIPASLFPHAEPVLPVAPAGIFEPDTLESYITEVDKATDSLAADSLLASALQDEISTSQETIRTYLTPYDPPAMDAPAKPESLGSLNAQLTNNRELWQDFFARFKEIEKEPVTEIKPKSVSSEVPGTFPESKPLTIAPKRRKKAGKQTAPLADVSSQNTTIPKRRKKSTK